MTIVIGVEDVGDGDCSDDGGKHRLRDATQPRASLGRPFHVLLAAVLLFGLANSSDTLLLLRAHSAGVSVSGLAFLFAAFNLVYAAMGLYMFFGEANESTGGKLFPLGPPFLR